MFSIAHNLYSLCKHQSEKKFSALVIGVDNAGKTTLINTVEGKITDPEGGNPTFGTSRKLVDYKTAKINLMDIGGGKNMRNYWKDMYCEAHAVIYVVDSSNPERFEESKELLHESVKASLLERKPVLVMLNKMDLPTAKSEGEVAQALHLDELPCATWRAQKCVAIRPDEDKEMDSGVTDGLDWLCTAVGKDFSQLDERVERDTVVQKEKEAEDARKAKEERRRKKEEREAKKAAEAAAAAEAVLAGAEATEVAVPLKVSPAREESGPTQQIDSNTMPQQQEAQAASSSTPLKGSEGHQSDVTPGRPDTPPQEEERQLSASTPPRLAPLPTATNLPELKGVPPPARLEPLTISAPDKLQANQVVTSPKTTIPDAKISNMPHVPLSPEPNAVRVQEPIIQTH